MMSHDFNDDDVAYFVMISRVMCKIFIASKKWKMKEKNKQKNFFEGFIYIYFFENKYRCFLPTSKTLNIVSNISHVNL